MAITSEKLAEWTQLARRDDAFQHFVPSDVRIMLGEIERLRAELSDMRRQRDNAMAAGD